MFDIGQSQKFFEKSRRTTKSKRKESEEGARDSEVKENLKTVKYL